MDALPVPASAPPTPLLPPPTGVPLSIQQEWERSGIRRRIAVLTYLKTGDKPKSAKAARYRSVAPLHTYQFQRMVNAFLDAYGLTPAATDMVRHEALHATTPLLIKHRHITKTDEGVEIEERTEVQERTDHAIRLQAAKDVDTLRGRYKGVGDSTTFTLTLDERNQLRRAVMQVTTG